MTNNLTPFSRWAKSSKDFAKNRQKVCVAYTRVSTKEQYENNLSLDFQTKAINAYALRNSLQIIEHFGGTFESAQTDGRKEFQRMITYVKKNKQVTHILVYLLDRFSRSGGEAIKIAKDLREDYGVSVLAVSQPIDTSNPGGVFQQNLQLLFSEYDNMLRKQRAIAGMKEKLLRGIWCIKPPMGYSTLIENGVRRIIINETGKKITQAFIWKLQGLKTQDILERLKTMGLAIRKQTLSNIFHNPFYCGIISNRMLDGQLVEGIHERIISREIFLKINQVKASHYGVPHKKERKELPLKGFVTCSKCGQYYTGYVVKAKGRFYYKCHITGCRSNKSALVLNEQFSQYLSNITIAEHLMQPLLFQAAHVFSKQCLFMNYHQEALQKNITDLDQKIESLQRKYFIDEALSQDLYEKLLDKLRADKQHVVNLLTNGSSIDHKLEHKFYQLIHLAQVPATLWATSEIKQKERLQKLIFSDRLPYVLEQQKFDPLKINIIFEQR